MLADLQGTLKGGRRCDGESKNWLTTMKEWTGHPVRDLLTMVQNRHVGDLVGCRVPSRVPRTTGISQARQMSYSSLTNTKSTDRCLTFLTLWTLETGLSKLCVRVTGSQWFGNNRVGGPSFAERAHTPRVHIKLWPIILSVCK